MKPQFICNCGSNKWYVYENRIECIECGNMYFLKQETTVKEFNKNRARWI